MIVALGIQDSTTSWIEPSSAYYCTPIGADLRRLHLGPPYQDSGHQGVLDLADSGAVAFHRRCGGERPASMSTALPPRSLGLLCYEART